MKKSGNETTGNDLKPPNYSVVNAEIARNHARRKMELKGIEQEEKHREICWTQLKIEVSAKKKYQSILNQKGRNNEMTKEKDYSR